MGRISLLLVLLLATPVSAGTNSGNYQDGRNTAEVFFDTVRLDSTRDNFWEVQERYRAEIARVYSTAWKSRDAYNALSNGWAKSMQSCFRNIDRN